MIATSTKVDISGVNLDKFDDKYFAKEAQKKKKKGEGEFFESDKEVGLLILIVFAVNRGIFLFFVFFCSDFLLSFFLKL
jgi:hypothetical protein